MLIMLPGPTNVPNEVIEAMTKPIIGHRGEEFHRLYSRISENLKYVFQTENDVFVLTSSGTGGVECAISNLISRGDKVIVPVGGVFSERLCECIEIYGGKPIKVVVDWGSAASYEQIEEAVNEHKDAKAVALVYNETSTGAKVRSEDMEKIGKLTSMKDMLFIVDAISILGGDLLPVDKWNIDVCITGSQKCLACPPGLALISVSNKALKVASERPRRGSFYFDFIKLKQFHEKRETPFTPAIPLFYALDAALELIKKEGLENRIERHRKCARAMYSGLEELGFKIYPREDFRSNTVIVSIPPNNLQPDQIRKFVREKHEIIIAGGMGRLKGKVIRIGCMGIVSLDIVSRTLSAIEDAVSHFSHTVK